MARFLVVDDDHPTVAALSKLLSHDGHEVAPFTHSPDAVDALSSRAFDAVVTDLDMPVLDGHDVVRATRELHPTACVVVATARAEENEQRLIDAGACIVADKPLDYDTLVSAIAECRAAGGPGAHGGCHMKAVPPAQLRRR